MSSKEKDSFILSGTAFWSHHSKVNEMSGKYQIDLSVDEVNKKLLESKGIKIKNKDADLKEKGRALQGNFVTLVSKFIPTVIDAKKQIINDPILIGNGSQVNIKTHSYDWSFKGKTGKSLGLDVIQIKTLVSVEKTSNKLDGLDEVDGFTHEIKNELGGFDEREPFD